MGVVGSDIVIRPFEASDLEACRELFRDGMIGGTIADNDSALDIDDIQSAYMESPGNHFWVAANKENKVVGMIGVMQAEEIGEIRRLRVHADHRRRGIGSALLEQALKFCQDQQFLKVTLDTFIEREAAVKLFEKFQFRLARTRTVHDKDLLYFYLDIYTSDGKDTQV
ncbi:MAG: GNAT family N-acetyltransferase [Burkholderiales bacterium]|nr:GNAT family N-acetyltransferase [Phycisphaerae bacterium]